MNTFKFKIENNDTEFKGFSVSNQKIPLGLFFELNKACHTVIDRVNGKTSWYDTLVRFEHNGKLYIQIKSEHMCSGCVFLDTNSVGCNHPYFDTKPNCDEKIYIVEHVFNK